jgi:hypothetical protein
MMGVSASDLHDSAPPSNFDTEFVVRTVGAALCCARLREDFAQYVQQAEKHMHTSISKLEADAVVLRQDRTLRWDADRVAQACRHESLACTQLLQFLAEASRATSVVGLMQTACHIQEYRPPSPAQRRTTFCVFLRRGGGEQQGGFWTLEAGPSTPPGKPAAPVVYHERSLLDTTGPLLASKLSAAFASGEITYLAEEEEGDGGSAGAALQVPPLEKGLLVEAPREVRGSSTTIVWIPFSCDTSSGMIQVTDLHAVHKGALQAFASIMGAVIHRLCTYDTAETRTRALESELVLCHQERTVAAALDAKAMKSAEDDRILWKSIVPSILAPKHLELVHLDMERVGTLLLAQRAWLWIFGSWLSGIQLDTASVVPTTSVSVGSPTRVSHASSIKTLAMHDSVSGSPRQHLNGLSEIQQYRKLCNLLQSAGGTVRIHKDPHETGVPRPEDMRSSLSSELVSCTELFFKMEVRDMLCCPVFDENGDTIGALQVLNKDSPPSATTHHELSCGFSKADETMLHRISVLFGSALSHTGAVRRNELQFDAERDSFRSELSQLQREIEHEHDKHGVLEKNMEALAAQLVRCTQEKEELRASMDAKFAALTTHERNSLASARDQAEGAYKKWDDEKTKLLQELAAVSAARESLSEQLQKLLKINKSLSKAMQEVEKKRDDQDKQAMLSLAEHKVSPSPSPSPHPSPL